MGLVGPETKHKVFTKRRAGLALFWATVVAVLMGSALGFMPSGRQDPPPAQAELEEGIRSLSLPAPMIGDRGLFSVSEYVVSDGRAANPTLELPHAMFEWLEPAEFRDDMGRLSKANVLRYVAYDGEAVLQNPNLEPTVTFDVLFYIHPESNRILGYETESSSQRVVLGETILEPDRNQTTYGHRSVFPAKGEDQFFDIVCGILDPYQGRDIPLPGPIALGAECRPLHSNSTGGQIALTAFAQGTVGGFPAVQFVQVPEPDADLAVVLPSVWLSEAVPYPLRIEAPTEEVGTVRTVRLSAFERGDSPLLSQSVVTDAGQALDRAPTRLWGPEDAGWEDHPYSLRAAVEFARNSLNLEDDSRAFVARGEDEIFLLLASYTERSLSPTQDEHQWELAFTDGHEYVRVCARRTYYKEHSGFDYPVAPPRLLYEEWNYSPGCPSGQPNAGFPLPRTRPDQVPTIASLTNRWQSYASPELAVMEPRGLRYEVKCVDIVCEKPVLEVAIGVVRSISTWRLNPGLENPEPVDSWEDEYRYSYLHLTDEGRALLLDEYLYSSVVGKLPELAAAAPVEPGYQLDGPDLLEVLPASIETAPWEVPGQAAVVGAGLAAATVGLLYLIAPFLKGLVGFSHYTRFVKSDALNHPMRATILHLIENNPGIHLQEVRRRLSLPNGTAFHHLHKLVQLGLITEISSAGFTSYFVKGQVDFRVMGGLSAIKSDTAGAVLRAVRANPGISSSRLAQVSGLNAKTVSYHIKRLQAVGLVDVVRSGKEVQLTPTPTASHAAFDVRESASLPRLNSTIQPSFVEPQVDV